MRKGVGNFGENLDVSCSPVAPRLRRRDERAETQITALLAPTERSLTTRKPHSRREWATGELVGHISRDATAIHAREKATAKPQEKTGSKPRVQRRLGLQEEQLTGEAQPHRKTRF